MNTQMLVATGPSVSRSDAQKRWPILAAAIIIAIVPLACMQSDDEPTPLVHVEEGPDKTIAARTNLIRYLQQLQHDRTQRLKDVAVMHDDMHEKETLKAYSHVMDSDDATVVAWLELAFRYDARITPAQQAPAFWAYQAFSHAYYRLHRNLEPRWEEIDLRFLKIVRDHRQFLFDKARHHMEKYDQPHPDPSLMNLFHIAAMWDSLPLYMEALEKDQDNDGDFRFRGELTNLTWRNPKMLSLRQWKKEFLQWWRINRKTMSTQAILDSARRWELAGWNRTARRKGRVLVTLMMDEQASKAVSDEDLGAVLDADWPRRRHCSENDKEAPPEEPMASAYGLVRDAAFLILYRRNATKALATMEAGLKRNDRVAGGPLPSYDPLDKYEYTAGLFKTWLDDKIKADILSRVWDKNLDAVTRFKWLIIHDQFFPRKGVWLICNIARLEDNKWIGDRRKIGVGSSHFGGTVKQIQQTLRERRRDNRP